jgi:hypothetical protein
MLPSENPNSAAEALVALLAPAPAPPACLAFLAFFEPSAL